MLAETLTKLGLTQNESKVYLALLKLGSGSAIELTKLSKVHRVNVYDALERLREKGLISAIMSSNKRIYEAANPEQLMNLLKEKEELLNNALPQLKAEFSSKKEIQIVHHFFGPEGVMRAYFMILEQKATLYALGGSGLNRKYMQHRHEMFNKERLKAGIKGKCLYYEFTRGNREKGWVDPTMEIRYLPDEYMTLAMVDICGNLVINLIPADENLTAIVIENKILAETYRKFFDFMWAYAKA